MFVCWYYAGFSLLSFLFPFLFTSSFITNPHTLVLFESPHRLLKLLSELKENLPETRRINISREISKIHEENINGTAEELLLHFQNKKVKGEIVLVIDKLPKKTK